MKNLPAGPFTFENLITKNFLYIDKTQYIYDMIQPEIGVYFLSRPRRFGKSLLVSTLKAIFEGKRHLFAGLWLAEQSDYPFDSHPVLAFDLSKADTETPEQLRAYLDDKIDELADQFGVTLRYQGYGSRFGELIQKLGHEQPVVILIDEYDKPLLDHLTSPHRDEMKTILKQFYTAIKASDAYLRFVLLTGVTKFSKISVFSGLNNLIDISMDSRYAELLGLTQAELERDLAPYIQQLAESQGQSYEDTLSKIRWWYNGYRFSSKESYVYNPFSTLLLLLQREFKFHWFETGTPTFLLQLIKQTPSSWGQVSAEKWAAADEFSTYEVEYLQPLPLLFQAGYLTIHEIDTTYPQPMYRLDYPNFEVENGFLRHLLRHLSGVPQESSHLFRLVRAFKAGDLETVFDELQIFFANIEYDLHLKYEKYYQTIIFAIFQLLGFNIQTEVKTNKGRVDAVVELDETIYLFEFKLFDTAQAALDQIKTNRYFERFKNREKEIVAIGVAFDTQEKTISEWVIERL